MSLRDHRQAAPDFTDAFLCTLGVILFVMLCTIAAFGGYICVAVTAWAITRAITWADRRRH